MTNRSAVSFTNRQGLRLFGVLHHSHGDGAQELGVLLLSPGVKMRVGPQRLYLRLTELFVRLGMPVLRFDFFGLGDSEGRLPEQQLKDVYNHIEVGRFVDDTVDAMDWMQQHFGTRRFILAGLCGGAVTGLLAGARDARVAGLLGLGITPLLASKSADPSRYMTAGQLEDIGRTYLQKLLDPTAWVRLITLQTDFRLLWRSVVRSRITLRHETPVTAIPEDDNASPLFPPAFFEMQSSSRPMLLVFGGSDRLHWEFQEKFVQRHGERLRALPPVYDVHVIENANHVLSFTPWQTELVDTSARWLRASFFGHLAS